MTKEEQDIIDRNHENNKKEIVFGLKYPFWEVVGQYKMPLFDENSIVVDIGANVGNFAIAVCMRGARNVIAFEPSEKAFQEALKNIEEHGYSQFVKLHHLAVWKSGNTKLNYNKDFESHQTLTTTEEKFENNIEVDCVSLDEVLKDLNRVDFMKIDVESSEAPILLSSKLLYEKVNKLSIECHRFKTSEHKELCETSPEELFEYLLSLGYEGEYVATTNNGISFIYINKNI